MKNTLEILLKPLQIISKKIPTRQIFFCEMVFESHSAGDCALFFFCENREHATQICDRETIFFLDGSQNLFIYFLFISEGVKNRFFMAH